MGLLQLLRPAPHIQEIEDGELVRKQYRHWRLRIFYGMYLGYVFYYFSRKSLTFAMPAILAETGFTMSDMGLLASLMSITYGISKFLSGVFADRSNPRYFLSIGLLVTGVCNILFGCSSTFFFFAVFSGLNGWFQGWGWPPCARQLTHWYSQKERGTWWGFWSTSHSLGLSGIAIMGAWLATLYGWRAAMYVPGVICILGAFFAMNRLRDTPQSIGLPPIEKFRNDYPAANFSMEQELTVKELLFKYVLNNSYIWILGAAYFFVYVIRTAVTDWGFLYLVETKGYSKIFASSCIVSFEVGGFCGSFAAGWLSDVLFKGKRGPISLLFSLGVIFPLLALALYPEPDRLLDNILFCTVGFFIYGPQVVIGMHAAELAHKKATGTATGFIGWIAYLGAAVAGYPLSLIKEAFGWGSFMFSLILCGLAAILLLAPLWSIRIHPKYVRKPEPA